MDLSNLKTLKQLDLSFSAWDSSFTVTGLPTSLESLNVEGFGKENIRIDARIENRTISDSLKEIRVSTRDMCCSEAVYEMFGRDLPSAYPSKITTC